MSQYILDCASSNNGPTCTLSNYSPPPETIYEYALGPQWMYGVSLGVIVVAIIAFSIVYYGKIEEGDTWGKRRLDAKKAELDAKARIAEAHNSCQNCGVTYAPKMEDIKT